MRAAGALLALALAGCASAPRDDPAAIADALAGAWSNARQYDAAPDALKRPPAPGHPYDWLDRQDARFWRVDAPGLGPAAVYLEWRGADAALSRQRLWVFRRDGDGAVMMDFYTFKDPARFAGRGAEAGAFAQLTAADLIGYGPACALGVAAAAPRRWRADITPQRCRIVARSGRTMGIAAAIRLDGDALRYSEAGVLEDGGFAFKVPGGGAYHFTRE